MAHLLQSMDANITSLIAKRSLGLAFPTNGSIDGIIEWWNDELQLSTTSNVEMVFDNPITCLALEEIEHRYLLSGTNNGCIYIHDLYNISGAEHHMAPVVARLDRETRPGHRSTVSGVSWYPLDTGLFLSGGSDCRLHVWDTNSMKKSETLKFDYKVICHSMSPVATAHSLIAVGGEDAAVTLCDLRSGASTHQLRSHAAASVDACQWSPAHQHLLATGARDKRVLFWDVRHARRELASLRAAGRQWAHRAPVAGLRFLADGRRLVSVGRDGAATLWDLLTGRPRPLAVPPLRVDNTTGLGYSLAVSAGRRPRAFLPCDAQLVVCDLASGAVAGRLDGHLRPVLACVHDASAARLLTAAADGHVLVWSRRRAGADGAAGAAQHDACRDEWSDDE